MTKDKKLDFLTYHTFKFIKIDILPVLHYVFFPLSAIENLFASKQKKTGGVRCRDLS